MPLLVGNELPEIRVYSTAFAAEMGLPRGRHRILKSQRLCFSLSLFRHQGAPRWPDVDEAVL